MLRPLWAIVGRISCYSIKKMDVFSGAFSLYRRVLIKRGIYFSHIGWLQAVPFLPSTLQRT